MRWICGGIVLGFLLLTTNLLAAELDSENMFRKIDDKIYKQLKNDRWDYVGKTFVRALWGDYKRAHDNVNPELSGTRIFAKSPDIKDYSEYLGAYIRDKKQTDKIFIEIKKSDKGTFFVKLTEYNYPAIATGKSIVFTTGIIQSAPILPQLAEKPYCMLKMFAISRINGKYFFSSPEASPDKWVEIFKKDIQK